MENEVTELKDNKLEKKVLDLENLILNQQKENGLFREKLSKLDSLVKCEHFKGQECKFTTDSEKGLKTHITRKHKTATNFPRKCDLCEMEVESTTTRLCLAASNSLFYFILFYVVFNFGLL